MQERIVITGLGTVNPLGLSVEESWRNAVNGVSGVAPITLFNPETLQVKIACEVKGFRPENFMDVKESRRRDRFEQLSVAAAREALNHSGLDMEKINPERVGVVISSAIGGIGTIFENIKILTKDGPRRVSPFTIPMMMSNGAAGLTSIEFGLRGPSLGVVSACASGTDGIGTAWLMLRAGVADVILAGASDSTINEVSVASFDRIGAMSRRNDDFSMTPSPFDRNRDGLVMGEGAAVLVLETESHARRRGAVILAELGGYAATADAFHITAPAEDGSGGARAIRLALASAGMNTDEVGYINAHGTATELNDLSETKAIKSAFGDLAYRIPVSSTKSMTGHMMGATGALETLFCVLAVRDGLLPPTIHYQTPDPLCDLDYVPNQARQVKIRAAINNSFGFGGHNAVVVVKAY